MTSAVPSTGSTNVPQASFGPERHVRTGPVALALVRRSLVAITRVPSALVPILLMPVFFMIAFTGSYSAITNIPGFPTDNIFNWFVPYACVQGAAFAGLGTGFTTARDIETGFYDRLLLAPSSRASLILGPIGTSVVRSSFPLMTVLPLGLLLGADFPGVLGLLMLAFTAASVSVMSGLWALGVVFRMQTQRSLGLVQIGIFATLFLSIGQVPLAVMRGWLHGAARVNPTTNLLRMARQGFLDGVTWELTWPGLVAAALVISGLGVFAVRGFKKMEK